MLVGELCAHGRAVEVLERSPDGFGPDKLDGLALEQDLDVVGDTAQRFIQRFCHLIRARHLLVEQVPQFIRARCNRTLIAQLRLGPTVSVSRRACGAGAGMSWTSLTARLSRCHARRCQTRG